MNLSLDANNNKEIKVARKRANHTIIALGCLIITIINMYSYIEKPVGGPDISMAALSITTYFLSAFAVILFIKALNRLFYPSKIKITSNGVELLVGFVTMKINNCTISIEENTPDAMIESFKNYFNTENPKVFTVKNADKTLSFVIDEKDLEGINKN